MLRSSVIKDTVGHAYLFAGPRGSGKTAAALAFAASLNCRNRTPEGDACGACISCRSIRDGINPDVRLVSPDGNQTKIEQVQEIIRQMSYAPLTGAYSVFIIERADTLNPSSENCMLKILEEPPSYGVIILLSANPSALLPTIRSRCRIVRFRRASAAEVERALAKRFELPPERLRAVAALSEGAVGKAVGMAQGPESMDHRRKVIEILTEWADAPQIISLKTAELLRKAAEPSKDDGESRTLLQSLTLVLDYLLTWYSDLLTLKVGGSADVVNVEYLDTLKRQAGKYSVERLQGAVQSIIQTRRYLEGNITPQLALENMLLELHPSAEG